jgi:2-polyprenyl-6-hydroxyphenyl methylase/3-demethylubiquinone-9 3-methyltransferase
MELTEQTIDPDEVAYYQRLAYQWWDKNGSFWPLHRLNELRVAYLRQEICQHFGRSPEQELPLRGLAIVDIGCGGGILSESMTKLGATVHGIDVVKENISVARQHSAQNNLVIEYSLTTVEALTVRGAEYDVVLNMEVVEHVADLSRFMSQCATLLNTDGIMFVATLNRNFLSWLFAIVGAEYILGWLPRGTHDWRKFVKPAELTQLFAVEGLATRASTGVRINPFNRIFSLSGRLTVNYMMSAVRKSRGPLT